jgi:signal transduction histidine kinase
VERPAATQEILAAYSVHDQDVRVRYSRVASVLVMVLVPAGCTLDWFVYPQLFREFLLVRLAVALLSITAFTAHWIPWFQRQIRWFAMLVPLLTNAAMSWMVLRSEGVASPYYAGINLVVAGISVLLPWGFAEVVIAGVLSISFYLGAVFLHGGVMNQVSALYNGAYFLVLNTVICATAAYFKARARFEEFRLRSELAQSYRQLSELERIKTEFFANISHELRTPLTLILAPLNDVLKRGADLPEDVRTLLALAQTNSLRLLKLINDLLEIIRIESDEFSLRTEPIDLAQFARNQTESVRQLTSLKGLDLEVDSPEAPLWTMADPVHIEKILLNLLTNAIKFTPKGGKISVRTRAEGRTIAIEVQDTGIGISPADMPYIFDRFRQADGSSTRRFSGIGIGLSLVKELAEKHGGRITAESRLGEGSTFRLSFPRHETPSERTAPSDGAGTDDLITGFFREADRFVAGAAQEGGDATNRVAAPAGSATVLVIDDEPDMRAYLASILADRYTVLSASDGIEGLALSREAHPDLVLVDLMMPGMDGWLVCSALKAGCEPAPKVVVITARTDEMSKIRALEQGADDFLGKPFSTLEVQTRLANLERSRALETSLRRRNLELEDAIKKLRSTEAQLVQREKMVAVSRLAGGILHEISNPLNFTLTAITIGLDRIPAGDKALQEILRDVEDGMLRIRDIVSDLRDFANPGSNERRDSFEFKRVVDRALQLTSPQLRDVRVEQSLSEPCPAYGSETQVLQVMMNLLLNAEAALRRVRADRKPLIRISAAPEGSRLRVSVWDNGTGIPANLLKKIFEPFVTTRDVGQGMGLGLSICHTLVAAHGGAMTAQSQEGQWTEVGFELPLLPMENAQ